MENTSAPNCRKCGYPTEIFHDRKGWKCWYCFECSISIPIEKPNKFGHTKAYEEYIASDAWKIKREQKLKSVGNKCQEADSFHYKGDGTPVCMCKGAIQVHHTNYRNLGDEEMSDLEVLCEYHHKEEHEHLSIVRGSWGNKKQYGR